MVDDIAATYAAARRLAKGTPDITGILTPAKFPNKGQKRQKNSYAYENRRKAE